MKKLLQTEDDSQPLFCFDLASMAEHGSMTWRVFHCLLNGLTRLLSNPAATPILLRTLTSYRTLMSCFLNKILFSDDSDLISADSGLALFQELLKRNPVLSLEGRVETELAKFIFSPQHRVTCARRAERLASLLVQYCRRNPSALVPAGWSGLDLLLSLRQVVKEPTASVRIQNLGAEEGAFLLNIELGITEASLFCYTRIYKFFNCGSMGFLLSKLLVGVLWIRFFFVNSQFRKSWS